MTYYDILQVSENASEEVIRMAYKALAKKYHPDVFDGDPKIAEQKMKELNEAYEVLSNQQKRMEYDAFIHKTTYDNLFHNEEKKSSNSNSKAEKETNKPRKELGLGASLLIIIALLFVAFSQALHPYIESSENLIYDNALIFGLRDFSLMCLLLSSIPLLIGFVKNDFSVKTIRLMCGVNSIVIFLVSLLLYICEITPAMSIRWIIALLYYLINVLMLRQICHYSKANGEKTPRTIIAVMLTVILITFISTSVGINSILGDIYNNDNSTNSEGTNVNSVHVDNDVKSVSVRTITLSDESKVRSIYNEWKNGEATESTLITIMNKYGANQGGGKLYIIKPGDYVDELDCWCFDAEREVGDSAIIKNDYGYTIIYISSIN